MMENAASSQNPAAGKIGIICNLKHADRTVQDSSNPEAEFDSMDTVRAIQRALVKHGLKACILEQDADLPAKLRAEGVAMVFNIAEGRGGRGREAQVPALLDYLGIPYTGSDPVALGISLDKAVTKQLAAAAGVRVPASVLVRSAEEALPENLAYPVLVKPDAEGSGKGLSEHCVAGTETELRSILARECAGNPEGMLVEQFLPGREFTVAMIGNGADLRIFPPMEILYHHATQGDYRVYSYQIKCHYTEHVSYQCPAALTPGQMQEMASAAGKVFQALGCRDVARADFRMDAEGNIRFLEINPLPGLAPGYSDLPMITAAAGMSYDDTVFAVYQAAAERLRLAPLPEEAAADSWDDWRWQFQNRIRDAGALAERLPLSAQEADAIRHVCQVFRMAVTPYYLSLINPADPDDPIRKMCVPSIREAAYCADDRLDPLNEDADSPVPHIVHRYPDRVLFLVTMECSEYCRFCTRRRMVGEEDRAITDAEMETAVDYIRAHAEIRDVLISGGDPLTLSTDRLEKIIKAVRAVDHVEIIRIGTRVPVVMPQRITDELLEMLKQYQPVWINTHFNHPNEITPESGLACRKIVDAGIPLGNQTVLLKGVNDNLETMRALMTKLVRNRVRPYYLYQCDLSRGTAHFRTTVEKGIEIMHGLQGYISGFAVPKFVIDCPGGGGKVPVGYNYIKACSADQYVLENYKGETYVYPQPKEK